MLPLTRTSILMLVARLFLACGNDAGSPPEKLAAGIRCADDNQCITGSCESVAINGAMATVGSVCCAIACAEGTACDASGGFCVQCTGPQCEPEAEPLGIRGLPIGAECQWNAECRDGVCRADLDGHSRCCEHGCSADTICMSDGRCGCIDGMPSLGPCDANGGDASSDGSERPLGVGQTMAGLGAASSNPSPAAMSSSDGAGTCGNELTEEGEECDGGLACTLECQAVICGNQRLDPGEECEPPSSAECSGQCQAYACGNRRLDPGEECEPPAMGACGDDCSLWTCGNGRVDTGEECDPPGTQFCDSTCHTVLCGNGRLDGDEGCDPPSAERCSETCHPVGCGDGVVSGSEECDPPVEGECDGSCLVIACGNQRLDSGEACDPPGQAGCGSTCTFEMCGDGRLDATEECEPPDGVTCSPQCTAIVCGNGRVDDGEVCEPGLAPEACSESCNALTPSGGSFLDTFDSRLAGWSLNVSSPPTLLQTATLVFSAEQGMPTAGSLLLAVPFTQGGQRLELKAFRSPALDVQGQKLRAQVRLLEGLAQAGTPGAIRIFAKSGPAYDYISGSWAPLSLQQSWVTVELDPAAPALQPGQFTAADVREIGFEVATFSGSQEVAPARLAIDSVELGQ
jgi:hypothetical protein